MSIRIDKRLQINQYQIQTPNIASLFPSAEAIEDLEVETTEIYASTAVNLSQTPTPFP